MDKYFLENPEDFGFILNSDDLYVMPDYKVVEVDTTNTNLTNFAKGYKINYQLLKDSNPWLRTNKLDNKNRKKYHIIIPNSDSLIIDNKNIKVHNKKWIKN